MKSKKSEGGYVLVYLLVIIFVFSMIMLPIINYLTTESRVLSATITKEEALQIAEAGINYYQWRLAHFPNDYQDGTGAAGPYVHDYVDADTGQTVGSFSLDITPPQNGSTVVTIKSTGSTDKSPNNTRTITSRYGIPSLALYAFLSNDVIWVGDTESVSGQLQSNNGVRFDGTGNAPIMSAKLTYTCPTTQGSPCPAVKNGVWGSASQAVKSFWQFPVPAVDFSSLTSDLATLKASAQSGGIYLPPSNAQGYSLVFNNTGSVTVYKVTSLRNNPKGWDTTGVARTEGTDYNVRVLQFTQNLTGNNIIYIEDKVWVEGVVKGRVMVAAAMLPYNPGTAPRIYIPNNIVYDSKDGTNVLGLLAQKDIVITYRAPDILEINAAMVSQNGSCQFYYWPGRLKDTITIFGSIMSFGQWTWSWANGGGQTISGYPNTLNVYDGNLLYSPPPGFPLSSAGYQQLNWHSN